MAEQLKKTSTGRITRLYMLATQALRRRNGNVINSGKDVAGAIQNDLGAIKELFEVTGESLHSLIERRAYEYARKVNSDMRGDALRGESGGHAQGASSQASSAPLQDLGLKAPIWAVSTKGGGSND